MEQRPLFDTGSVPAERSAVVALGVPGAGRTLTKAQKQFNQLVARLKAQRADIKRWRTFQHTYHQLLADKYAPLARRLREKRIAMAQLLDRALDSDALAQRDRRTARDILESLVVTLIAESADPDLIALHDKYAEFSFEDIQRYTAEAEDGSGAGDGADGADAADGADDEPQPHHTRKKSAKAAEREALRMQVAEGGTRAVRDAYRKLVSELHPDRESDPAEQARKTELMQRVNQAYKGGDLLGLLELQLATEQLDEVHLANLGDERLRHYIHVLEEQSRQLRDELAEVVAPFSMTLDGSRPRKVTPEAVERALADDIRDMKEQLGSMEADLIRYRDLALLKRALRGR